MHSLADFFVMIGMPCYIVLRSLYGIWAGPGSPVSAAQDQPEILGSSTAARATGVAQSASSSLKEKPQTLFHSHGALLSEP